jgi:probable HAF family extracellular repeat protein
MKYTHRNLKPTHKGANMKSRTLTCITAMTLFAALATPARLAAQHTRYKLIDLGTPGGPNSYPTIAGPGIRFLNDAGTVAGWGDTTAPDPTCFGNDGLCLLTHTFRWERGTLTDLGALPGTNSSAAVAINAAGWILGVSENGLTDALSGFPEIRAVLWKHDQLTELGALGNLVFPQNLNNVGQAIGGFENTTPDPFSLFGLPTQTRAFLWQKGVMQDIGTLGGPDAFAFSINERGQVAGMSYTNAVPNETTGIPTLEPFLWDHGKMNSLGTLGGTVGSPGAEGSIMLNNRGQIIGTSNLAGDLSTHAFVWENGVMTNLGTLGGPNSYPLWINDRGDIVGEADISFVENSLGQFPHHAFLWRNGTMTDLGTLGSTSHAESINNKGQVVGRSRPGSEISVLQHGFLWENGGPMIDLNTLIPAGSNFQLIDAYDINDRGEILVQALPLGEQPMEGVQLGHLALLVPCEPDSCNDSSDGSATAAANSGALMTRANRSGLVPRSAAEWRAQLAERYHMPGAGIQQH